MTAVPTGSAAELHEEFCEEVNDLVREGILSPDSNIAKTYEWLCDNESENCNSDLIDVHLLATSRPWKNYAIIKLAINALEKLYGRRPKGQGAKWRCWKEGWRWVPKLSKDGKQCVHWFYPPKSSVGSLLSDGRLRAVDVPTFVDSMMNAISY